MILKLIHYSTILTYLDNDFINKDEYRKTLELNALSNVNRLLVDIEGRWGINSNTNHRLIHTAQKNAFLRWIHTKYQTNITPKLVSDFNANPTYLQQSDN